MVQPPLPPEPVGQPPAAIALTFEQLAQIVAARKLGAKIDRAVSFATLDGWVTGIFAALTIVGSITSPVGLILGVGMAVVSYHGFQGAKGLKRLDLAAPRRLALNQLAFGAMLFIYGGINTWISYRDPHPLASAGGSEAQVAEILAPYERMVWQIMVGFYLTVMVIAIAGPGLMALYYYRRTKHVMAYLNQTPQWLLDLQRAGMRI